MGIMAMYDSDDDDEEFGGELIVEEKHEEKPAKEKAKVKPRKITGKEIAAKESEKNKNKSNSTPRITYKPPIVPKRHSERGKKVKKEIAREKEEDRIIKEKVESGTETSGKQDAVKSEKKDAKPDNKDVKLDKKDIDEKDTKSKAQSKNQQTDTHGSNEETEPEPKKKTEKSDGKPKLRPLILKSWEAKKYSDNAAEKGKREKNYPYLKVKKRRRSAPVTGNVTDPPANRDRRSQTAQRPRSPKSPSTSTYRPGEKIK